MIHIGNGLLNQIKSNYNYPNVITKESLKEVLLSIKSESFCTLWEDTFDETFEEFINKSLNYDSTDN